MRLQAFLFLFAGLGLSACVTAGPPGAAVNGYSSVPASGARGAPEQLVPEAGNMGRQGAPRGRPIAVLLPLSGPLGDRGQAMLKSAQLALDQPGAPALDVRDTGGTPEGAATMVQQALAAGDGMIVGPLTAGETAAVAGPAQAARVPVLAFTSDPGQARPGVWVLGLTPGQQVRRLVEASQAAGVQRFAALLPDNDYGRLMGNALTDAVTATGGMPPTIRRYSSGMQAITAAVRDISDYADRRGPLDAQIKAARARNDAEGRQLAADLARQPPAPAPFDALLLADTGSALNEIGSLLPYYDIEAPPVRILGPALWASPAARAGSGGLLNNAFYAAPDPTARNTFETSFTAKYGVPPGPLSDLAYDATSLARVVTTGGGDPVASLCRPEGFAGADGVIVLSPDGRVRRGLAVFQIRSGSPSVIDPAPQSLAGTQS